jgi:hypothetical protein
MKHVIFVSMIFCALLETKAQIQKGSLMIGGSMNLQRQNINYSNPSQVVNNNNPMASFSMSPTVGYFFIDGLMVGVQPSLTYNWSLSSSYKATTVGLGPVVRYYIPVGKFAIFPELGLGLNATKSVLSGFDAQGVPVSSTDKTSTNSFRGGVGATWFVSPNIGVEAIFSYRSSNYNSDTLDRRIGLLALNFGLQFYLPKKD